MTNAWSFLYDELKMTESLGEDNYVDMLNLGTPIPGGMSDDTITFTGSTDEGCITFGAAQPVPYDSFFGVGEDCVSFDLKMSETKILNKLCADENFCKRLADWADIIRKTFYDGGIEEIISTRRLVHIIKAYNIFGDKAKAIQVCVNRFDDETKQAFLELYDKVDADFEMPVDGEEVA